MFRYEVRDCLDQNRSQCQWHGHQLMFQFISNDVWRDIGHGVLLVLDEELECEATYSRSLMKSTQGIFATQEIATNLSLSLLRTRRLIYPPNGACRRIQTNEEIHVTRNQTTMTTKEVAARFLELAQQERWFEIQDEFFAEDVRSVEPPTAKYLHYAEGKAAVRNKGEDFVKRIEAVHSSHTTAPVVGGEFFAVGREIDITVQGLGRMQMNEVMLYQVRDGRIVLEQFFY